MPGLSCVHSGSNGLVIGMIQFVKKILYFSVPHPTSRPAFKVACTSCPVFEKNYEAVPNIFCANN